MHPKLSGIKIGNTIDKDISHPGDRELVFHWSKSLLRLTSGDQKRNRTDKHRTWETTVFLKDTLNFSELSNTIQSNRLSYS